MIIILIITLIITLRIHLDNHLDNQLDDHLDNHLYYQLDNHPDYHLDHHTAVIFIFTRQYLVVRSRTHGHGHGHGHGHSHGIFILATFIANLPLTHLLWEHCLQPWLSSIIICNLSRSRTIYFSNISQRKMNSSSLPSFTQHPSAT